MRNKRIKSILTKKFLIKHYTCLKKNCQIIANETNIYRKTILVYLKKFNIQRRKGFKRTLASRKKQSDTLKRRGYYPTLKHYYGEKNYNYKDGKYIKEYYCKEKNCNNKIHLTTALKGQGRCPSCSQKNRNKDPRNASNYGKFGKLSGNYIHGQGYAPYPIEFNERFKYKIRTRDNFECQNCGMTEEEHIVVHGRVLDVHHIDYDKTNCKEYNLITACTGCNLRANGNRDYWYAYFTYIMEEKLCCLKN